VKKLMTRFDLISNFQSTVISIAKRNPALWAQCGSADVLDKNYWRITPDAEHEIIAAEQRLGTPLPKDFRQFLRTFGAFPLPGFGYDGRFLGAGEINFGARADPSFAGLASRQNSQVLNIPLRVDGQDGISLSRSEYERSIVITDDKNAGSSVGLIAVFKGSNPANFEYIDDDAWEGSYRFRSFDAYLSHLFSSILRTLDVFGKNY
jgi:hypothetical protein